MKLFTSKTRTREYLRKIKNRGQDDFPANERGDVLLVLSSSRIYEPYVDDEEFKHVARKYFSEGLEFLVGNAVRVMGDSEIDYYAPGMENDLQIRYEGTISFPVIIRTGTSSASRDATTKRVTISSKTRFNERVKMHLDAYEWRYFTTDAAAPTPSYVWLPHPEYLGAFKEILRSIVPKEKRRQPIEEKLDAYYSII